MTNNAQEADEPYPYSADLVTWTTQKECDSVSSGREWRVWDSDTRLSSTYAEPRHRGAVLVMLGWDVDASAGPDRTGRCSGVMVAPDMVLTAAHCLVDRGGTDVISKGEIEVCTHGNQAAFASSATCAQGERFVINPAYRQGTRVRIPRCAASA